MANRKKEVYKPKPMTEGKRNLIQGRKRKIASTLTFLGGCFAATDI